MRLRVRRIVRVLVVMGTEDFAMQTVQLVVMAKPVTPGRVKTRLIGRLDKYQAATIHAAMLRCVLARTQAHVASRCGTTRMVLAVDDALIAAEGRDGPIDTAGSVGVEVPRCWHIATQGPGDLGERLERVWRRNPGPIIFFGVDSPDVPRAVLRAILPRLAEADVAVGPVDDGGYWTIACGRCEPRIFRGIDWGSPRVYHQTVLAVNRAGLSVARLPAWHDVDRLEDLTDLQTRLEAATETPLRDLRAELNRVCGNTR